MEQVSVTTPSLPTWSDTTPPFGWEMSVAAVVPVAHTGPLGDDTTKFPSLCNLACVTPRQHVLASHKVLLFAVFSKTRFPSSSCKPKRNRWLGEVTNSPGRSLDSRSNWSLCCRQDYLLRAIIVINSRRNLVEHHDVSCCTHQNLVVVLVRQSCLFVWRLLPPV